MKRKNTALQMQQFVGEEKNDLLDYLRSLQPEKVPFKSSFLIMVRPFRRRHSPIWFFKAMLISHIKLCQNKQTSVSFESQGKLI